MNLLTIPAFSTEQMFHVVVESPKGSHLKLKYEPGWEAMGISRPAPVGLPFPFDRGFGPATRGPDGDPVDAVLMWDLASFPGGVVECRALGLLRVEQNAANFDRSRRVRNDRILALPATARRESDCADIDALPLRTRDECVQVTLAAAALEGKDVVVLGWGTPHEAIALISESTLMTADHSGHSSFGRKL